MHLPKKHIQDHKNSDSADVLVLESSTDKARIEFDLGSIASSTSIFKVVRSSLRLFVTSVTGTGSISIHSLPRSLDWDKLQVTSDHLAEHSDWIAFWVSPAEAGRWIEIDVTEITDRSQVNTFVLSTTDVAAGHCEFASRDTCHSSKLVVVTESI